MIPRCVPRPDHLSCVDILFEASLLLFGLETLFVIALACFWETVLKTSSSTLGELQF